MVFIVLERNEYLIIDTLSRHESFTCDRYHNISKPQNCGRWSSWHKMHHPIEFCFLGFVILTGFLCFCLMLDDMDKLQNYYAVKNFVKSWFNQVKKITIPLHCYVSAYLWWVITSFSLWKNINFRWTWRSFSDGLLLLIDPD